MDRCSPRPDRLRQDKARFWKRVILLVAFIALTIYAGWFAPWCKPRAPAVVPLDVPARRAA